ncbi:DHS-like NAD/FAD-binding domain-containing protein [Collybia nuda]|uniref:DHS-like NAD/FAD-binding domain-containing protein n=1 Tax=Collybia nuda TaxID=64659 RepID=A0A9P6CKE5_9AGAR|nr:DHS-like NAD/FAD-binding domain-containing protein [Collybia nuda]
MIFLPYRLEYLTLQSNLARLNLPHPEAVFEINFFRRNPVPFYTLAHELYPGKFRPTPTHSFIRLLAARSLLHMCFTQNIDTLERIAGVPDHLIIEAHGSFASQSCIVCDAPFDGAEMRRCIAEKRIAKCLECTGLVKPDIVFFGEGLPKKFISAIPSIADADLLIIIGTSLTVHPFASLAGMAERQSCPRVLINIERVGDLGSRRDDVVLLGKCDDIVRELCKELGWSDELEKLWAETQLDENKEEENEKENERKEEKGAKPDENSEGQKEEMLKEEVENLAAAIAARLDLVEGTKGEEKAPDERLGRKASELEPEVGEGSKGKLEDSGKVLSPQPDTVDAPDVTQGPYYKPKIIKEAKVDSSVDSK